MEALRYSRAHPSPRYLTLLTQYRQLHEEGSRLQGRAPSQVFPGQNLLPQLARIKALISRTGAETILDYGCGKGHQYELRDVTVDGGRRAESVVDYWEVVGVHCYDPGYAPFSQLPVGSFDGVISTDVLEHCPEEDVPWIVGEIFSYARLFVFANIASYAARSVLPTGQNAHCTVQPASWWDAQFRAAGADNPAVQWELWVHSTRPGGGFIDERLSNLPAT